MVLLTAWIYPTRNSSINATKSTNGIRKPEAITSKKQKLFTLAIVRNDSFSGTDDSLVNVRHNRIDFLLSYELSHSPKDSILYQKLIYQLARHILFYLFLYKSKTISVVFTLNEVQQLGV